MEKKEFEHTLTSGQTVRGKVYQMPQLSAKFQIWARQYGLTDKESLACWIDGDRAKQLVWFGNTVAPQALAKQGFEKIKGIEIPDISNI